MYCGKHNIGYEGVCPYCVPSRSHESHKSHKSHSSSSVPSAPSVDDPWPPTQGTWQPPPPPDLVYEPIPLPLQSAIINPQSQI